MPELRDALREATNKIGVIAGNPQLIVFDAMLTSYPAITIAGPIGFSVNPANAFAGASATIELIANGANVPTFTGIAASGSWVNSANAVNRIHFECLPSGAGSVLAFYAKISQPTGSPAAGVTSVAGKTGAVTLDKGDVGLGAVNNTADADKPISTATATALTNLSAATQPRDSDLTAIAGLPNSNGLIRKTSDGNAVLQPITSTGAAVIGGDAAAGRGAIEAEARSDNYVKGNYTLLTGGTLTSERWIFLPVAYDIYNRINISRAYNDDTSGGGALSAVIEASVGVWGSSGLGAVIRCAKLNEYSWPGAFVGATEHLLREVRLLESSGTETTYTGIWIRVMGARTYKFSGLSGAPIDYATYVPTIGTPLGLLLPQGTGTWERGQNNYYSPYRGWDLSLATIGALTANSVRCTATGAAITQILSATKTAAGTNPETIAVTGAAVGDVAWLSEAVPAKVTAPNTVSFNGVGLSGTIRAIVMRAQ